MPVRTASRVSIHELDSMFARILESTPPQSRRPAQAEPSNFHTQWKSDTLKDIAERQKERRRRTPEQQIAELDRRQEPAWEERKKLAKLLGKKQLPITS